MSRRVRRTLGVVARSAGFTLIEVMAVLAIMSLIMVGLYTTLDSTLDTRELLAREARAARLGPTILDIFEADLRRVWILGIEEDNVFKGETRNLLGEAADQLVMLSAVDSTLTRRVENSELTADVCETGYKLRINPELPDVLELWRRQQFHIDEEPLEGGVYERLHDRVVSFRLKYYEDNERDTEPEDEWDAAELHKLPAMVEVELGLEVIPRTGDENRAERESRVRWYRRLIPMQRNSQLAMRVRPIVPGFQGSAPGGGGGGGGGEAGGGGGPGNAAGPGDGGGGPGDDPFGGGGMGGMGGGGGPGNFGGGMGMGGGLGGGDDLGTPPDPGDVDVDPDPGDDIDIEDLLDDIFGGG